MHNWRVICTTLCLAAAGVSQIPSMTLPAARDYVVPHGYATKEGTGSTNIPFGRSVPVRAQFAYAPGLLASPVVIKELGMRPDQGFKGATKRLKLRTHLATLAFRSVEELDTEFAKNRGLDLTEVFGSKYLSLPGKSTLPAGVAFPIRIPFDRSFRWKPQNGPLLTEFEVLDQPYGSYRLDSTYVCDSPLQYYGPKGCGPAGGPTLKLESMTMHLVWGNFAFLRVSGAKPDALTLLFFGTQGSGTWNGIPLPFHADVIGAPGCYLSTSVLWVPRLHANQQGFVDYGFVVPQRSHLKGVEVTVQAIAEDRAANALGVISSQAARLRICGFEPVGRVFANGVDPKVGALELGVAPILQFRIW